MTLLERHTPLPSDIGNVFAVALRKEHTNLHRDVPDTHYWVDVERPGRSVSRRFTNYETAAAYYAAVLVQLDHGAS